MATLSNTPRQALHLTLERRKSYSFIVQVLNADSTALNLAGCSLRLTVKRSEWDTDNFDTTAMVQNKEALVTDVASGQGVFYLQAAELDWDPGEYYHTITLTTEAGFSVVIAKGLFTLLANTDSTAMQDFYEGGTATAAAEIQLRGQDTVRIVASTLTQSLMTNNIIQGTGRPDQSSTLDAVTLSLVTGAAVGQFFLSKDGNYQGLWIWQLMPNKTWRVVSSDASSATSWSNLSGKPSTFPPSAHSHAIGDVAGLQAALDALDPTGDVTTLGSRVATLETTMATKANQSSVNALTSTVGTKADQSTVSALASTVSTKADQSVVSALASTVSTKADQSTVAAMQDELTQTTINTNSKAEQSELTWVYEQVLTKADQTALDTVIGDVAELDDRVTVLEAGGGSGGSGGSGGPITSEDIADATTVGRTILTAPSAAAARTALGIVGSSTVTSIWVGTWSELEGVTLDPNILYFISQD